MKSYGITVERIDIPHAAKTTSTSGVVCSRQVTADLIIKIGSDLEKHRTVADIAARRNISMELTEQIVRLYVTHPGVTAEQIMSKMGLRTEIDLWGSLSTLVDKLPQRSNKT